MANERDLKNAREIAKANEAAAKTAKELIVCVARIDTWEMMGKG